MFICVIVLRCGGCHCCRCCWVSAAGENLFMDQQLITVSVGVSHNVVKALYPRFSNAKIKWGKLIRSLSLTPSRSHSPPKSNSSGGISVWLDLCANANMCKMSRCVPVQHMLPLIYTSKLKCMHFTYSTRTGYLLRVLQKLFLFLFLLPHSCCCDEYKFERSKCVSWPESKRIVCVCAACVHTHNAYLRVVLLAECDILAVICLSMC